MDFKLWHRISALLVFLISTAIFLMTVAPTLSFWDCGEFINAAVTMGVPHPPGAPFFQLVGRIFSLIPFADDLGFRVNLISTFSSSLTVLFVYLVSMRLLRNWRGEPKTSSGAILMILSSVSGALILAFSDTFWFNSSEAEVYGIGMFFISAVVWIALEWYSHAGMFDSERSLLLIAYMMGLSIGVHLLSLLALFFVFFLIFFRDRSREDMTSKNVMIFLVLMIAGFAVIYPGIVKYIPEILSGPASRYFLVLIVLGLIAVTAAKKLHPQMRMIALSVLLVTLGYSTYTSVIIRANQNPAMNENDPDDLTGLYSYLNRDQYGSYPLLKGPNYDERTGKINYEVQKFFPRRWNGDERNVREYRNYSSDMSFFFNFQLGHIYMRYFLWNFVGRAGDIQDAPPVLIGTPEANWSESKGYPNRYYAIPLILGLLGMAYHFMKDRRTFAAMAALFFMTGIGLVIYLNMAEPQVRERDYFFIGSFYVFSIWAGLGIYGIWDYLNEKAGIKEAFGIVIAVVLFLGAPANMLAENYRTHTRHYNFVPFDYAYNLLQSCNQDGILFTGGDNDTFPVWFLQYSAGIRRDVRVVNLSLVNTHWYAKQLKNDQPYGAKPVKLTYDDSQLERMEAMAWETRTLSIPIDRNSIDLSSMKDVPQLAQQEIPQTLDFVVKPTFTDPRGNKGLRNQELMVIDILQNNLSTRPIYFALSTSPEDRVGLDEHLLVEGLVARVTPFTFEQRGDRYYPAINVPATKRHLMETRNEPDSNRAFGFMFRELNNPDVNLDESSTKMIMTFRYLYMGLTQVIYQDFKDYDAASTLLRKMNEVMPMETHFMDPIMKTDLSQLYYYSRDTSELRVISEELEDYYMGELDKDITGRSSARSPYSVLLNMYETLKDYKKGVNLMKKFKQAYPGDTSVNKEMRRWEQMARGGPPELPPETPSTVEVPAP